MDISQSLVDLNQMLEHATKIHTKSLVSENDESYASEPESLCKESDIIFCGSDVASNIPNSLIAPKSVPQRL